MKRKFLNIAVILALMPFLQGCFILAGAAALGGGYFVGTKAGKREEERVKTQALVEVKQELEAKEKVNQVQDQGIANTINQNLVAGTLSTGVAIYPEVREGVVILHGRVPDQATAARAINAAKSTPGVERIISNLVVISPQQYQAQQQQQFQQSQQQLQQQYMLYQQQYQQQMQQQQYPAQQYQVSPTSQQPDYQPIQTPAPINNYPQMQQPVQQPAVQEQQIPLIEIPVEQQPQGGANLRYDPVKQKLVSATHKTPSAKVAPVKTLAAAKTKKEGSPPPKRKAVPAQPKKQAAVLSDDIIDTYSEDNDSAYKEYRPRQIKKAASSPKRAPQKKEVIYVPVPVPAPDYDNDSLYRNMGAFNPTPIVPNPSYAPPAGNMPSTNIPVPTPNPAQDNDNFHENYYYQ